MVSDRPLTNALAAYITSGGVYVIPDMMKNYMP